VGAMMAGFRSANVEIPFRFIDTNADANHRE
jgi:hypothetical protein